MNISPVQAELFHADGQTDRWMYRQSEQPLVTILQNASEDKKNMPVSEQNYRYITSDSVSCKYKCRYFYLHSTVFLDAATLTEVFPCFFLSCKANAGVNLAKMGHGPHSPKYMYCLFCVVLCIVLCVNLYCTTDTG